MRLLFLVVAMAAVGVCTRIGVTDAAAVQQYNTASAGVNGLNGLPAFSPSTMPTRFYDSTEYDVAPFVVPLQLPATPPEPAFIQTRSAAQQQMQQQRVTAALGEHVLGRMDAVAESALAEARASRAAAEATRRQQQQQRWAMLQRQQQEMAAMKATLAAQQQQQLAAAMAARQASAPAQPTAASFLQSSSHVHQKAKAHSKGRSRAHARHHSKHHAHHATRHHATAARSQAAAAAGLAAQHRRQQQFEGYASRMRFIRRPMPEEADSPMAVRTPTDAAPASGSVGSSFLETASRSRAQSQAQMQAQFLQQQLSNMQAQAAARASQTAYLNGANTAQRMASRASRPPQPYIGAYPQSIAARGYVPHFAPTVRAFPSAQPVQPYASFFEAGAQEQQQIQQQQQMASRPQEPFLPRLPPPPIVLSEW